MGRKVVLAYKQAQRKNGEEEVRVKGGRPGSSLELGTGEMYSPLLNRVGLVEHSDEARTWRWILSTSSHSSSSLPSLFIMPIFFLSNIQKNPVYLRLMTKFFKR